MHLKSRIFAEYRPGPQVGAKRDYTRILVTPPLPIDHARAYLESNTAFNPAMRYVQLQAVPPAQYEKVVKI